MIITAPIIRIMNGIHLDLDTWIILGQTSFMGKPTGGRRC